MAERQPTPRSRPRPGPRPATRPTSAHGSVRRRTQHRPTPPARSSIPSRKTAEREPSASRSGTTRWWAIVALAAVIAFVTAIYSAPVFEVNAVQISGAARTSEGAILQALNVPDDKALFTYDTDAGAEAVANLPWVKSVSVSRQWPSTLRTVVRERAVLAAVGTPSGRQWFVVGEDRIIVEVRMTPPPGVPLIVATENIVEPFEVGEAIVGVDRALDVALDVPLQLDPWITTWRLSDRAELVAHLVGTAEANFGIAENHRTQFVSLASILDGGAHLVCLDLIDLRVADTPVLHRSADCLLAARDLSS